MPKFKKPSQKMLTFWHYYTSPSSPTYDNITQSAIQAGYSEQYARKTAYRQLVPFMYDYIKNKYKPKQRKDAIEKVVEKQDKYDKMLEQAEKNLADDMSMNTNGDKELHKIKNKTSMFVSERLGKDRWSSRKEVENVGKAVIPENTLNALENAFASLTDAKHDATRAEYEVIGGETVRNDEEKDQNA